MSKQTTPGPWRRFGGMVDGYGLASDAGVIVEQAAFNGLENEANARLLAAAPALFNALDNIVGDGAQFADYCDKAEHDGQSPCIFCAARAVLTEARV